LTVPKFFFNIGSPIYANKGKILKFISIKAALLAKREFLDLLAKHSNE